MIKKKNVVFNELFNQSSVIFGICYKRENIVEYGCYSSYILTSLGYSTHKNPTVNLRYRNGN